MKDFAIVVDSASDIDKEFQDKYGIEVVPGHIMTPAGEEVVSGNTWDKWTREEFFEDLKRKPNDYSTSPASPMEFQQVFEKYIKEGKDVLSISLSSGISGTYNFTQVARNEILEDYPDAKIYCVDSMRFGIGFGLIAVYASILRSEGKSIDEVMMFINENKNRIHQTGWLDDLSFVAKKGRLTNAKAFFGTLAGVKPLGEFDYNGLTTVIGKVKGSKNAYKVLLEYMAKEIENPKDQIIFISQSMREKQALEYKKMIEKRFHPKDVIIKELHAVNGVNVGPGLMAAYYMGKPISSDLSEEKELMSSIIDKL